LAKQCGAGAHPTSVYELSLGIPLKTVWIRPKTKRIEAKVARKRSIQMSRWFAPSKPEVEMFDKVSSRLTALQL